MGRSLLATDQLYSYLLASQPPEHEELRKLREFTATLPNRRFQIAPEQAPFLAFLVRLIGARNVLELGTFTGYSTLAMALALPPDGQLMTCDISKEWPAIGRQYWERASVNNKITVCIGPACETLDKLKADRAGKFDLVFVNANKTGVFAREARRIDHPGQCAIWGPGSRARQFGTNDTCHSSAKRQDCKRCTR